MNYQVANDELIAKITTSGISVPNISDALDYLGTSNQVITNLLPRTDLVKSAGRALLVEWRKQRKRGPIMEKQASTWSSVRDFILPDLSFNGKGRCYVAGAGFEIDNEALLGGLSSTYLIEQLGFESIILSGAIRDIEDLKAIKAPIFSSAVSPIDTQGAYEAIADVDFLQISSVIIKRYDIVVSDENGIAVVPKEIEYDVVNKAIELKEREDKLMTSLREGHDLPALISKSGHI